MRPQPASLSHTGDTTALTGATKTLTCSTTSTGVSFGYTFYKDTVAVTAGVSGDTLTLSSPTTSDSGSYTCVVTYGATVSDTSSATQLVFIGEFVQALLILSRTSPAGGRRKVRSSVRAICGSLKIAMASGQVS